MSDEYLHNAPSSREDAASAPGVAPEERISDFSPEWCRKLLDDPSYEQSNVFSRRSTQSATASFNTLMRKTLFTGETIRAMRYLYKPRESFEQTGEGANLNASSNRMGGELLALISVGSDLCSHSDVLHGGINTVLVDEIGGSLAFREIPESHSLMAVNFNVNLRRSVRTPGIVLGRAWVERAPEGRKVWVKVQLEQNDQVCIESENMYLKIKAKGNL